MSHYGRKRISCPGQWKTCLVDEKPTTFFSHLIQDWIEAEKNKPGKRWIFDVITCGREESLELIRTPEFVLLPDGSMLSCVGRDVLNAKGVAQKQISRWTAQSGSLDKDTDQKNRRGSGFGLSADGFVLHLLAIVADCNLRCLRDLTGDHIAMLKRLEAECLREVESSFGIGPQNVMIFLNYPPSVYQLHFHICAPFQRVLSYDAFRMHSLTSIVSNLQMDPAYYQKVTFRMPVLLTSDMYSLLHDTPPECTPDTHVARGPKNAAKSTTEAPRKRDCASCPESKVTHAPEFSDRDGPEHRGPNSDEAQAPLVAKPATEMSHGE